jgi:lipoprotein-releasing system permease protein
MIEYFIAKRIYFQHGRKNVSRPAVRIAIVAIALGMAVMIISVGVVIGFKQEIRNKVVGFGGHIRVSNYDNNNTFETNTVTYDKQFSDELKHVDGVQSVQLYATKLGIIKTTDEFQGIVLKGIDRNFNWSFFKSHLVAGDTLQLTDSLRNDIVISKHIADMLRLKVGDSFYTYFIKDQVKARKFIIRGIYATNFVEYDKLFIITDVRHIQRLSGWESNQYSGYEVLISNFENMEVIADTINVIAQQSAKTNDSQKYYVQTIKELSPQLFGWLDLLDMNVWVILSLMLAVAGFNMISGLLILILERTNMIGILKSVGATNWSVRKVFLYFAVFLIGKGMFWGNLIGISLCALQYFTHILPLDPEAYYVSYIPIVFTWSYLLLLNAGTFVASVLMMIVPSYLISKISPAKIIRYE